MCMNFPLMHTRMECMADKEIHTENIPFHIITLFDIFS